MSVVKNQQSLYTFINTKLNENSYDVSFRGDLFNSDDMRYHYTDLTGYKHRFVPYTITDVIGEYLNVPNANSTSNNVSVIFDIFTGITDESDLKTDEFESVNYANTMSAIEEFKAGLLAQYFPLGTPYLYMGGEDSYAFVEFDSTINNYFYYLKFIPFNTDEEEILRGKLGFERSVLSKDATDVIFQIDTGVTISVPYTVNEENEITIFRKSSGEWTIYNKQLTQSGSLTIGNEYRIVTTGTTDFTLVGASVNKVGEVFTATGAGLGTGTVYDASTSSTTTFNPTDELRFGYVTGFEGVIQRLVMHNTLDIESLEKSVDIDIDLVDWNSKDSITNSGDLDVSTSTVNNCILWSTDGNAIFGFGTINPISDVRPVDGGALYQMFELEMSVFISNDVLFGNNFEYYLDSVQVYPIDREHTLGTDINGVQYINSSSNEFIVSESVREHTMSFYYIPTKQLNSLLKHVVTGDTGQNTTYTLLVQYPFFQKSYDVVIDSGGINPNVNTLASFTVVFKKADSEL